MRFKLAVNYFGRMSSLAPPKRGLELLGKQPQEKAISKNEWSFSHGVAADGSPRREPWAGGENLKEPRSGERIRIENFLSLLPGLKRFSLLTVALYS